MTELIKLTYDVLERNVAEIVQIENDVMDQYPGIYDLSGWSEKEFLARRTRKDDFSCGIKEANELRGFSISYEVKPSYAHISRFAVRKVPSKRLGSQLLDFQIKLLRDHNISTCSVDLIKTNEAALRLYSSNGFEKLEGDRLVEYVSFRNRKPEEYLTSDPSHIAMLKIIS